MAKLSHRYVETLERIPLPPPPPSPPPPVSAQPLFQENALVPGRSPSPPFIHDPLPYENGSTALDDFAPSVPAKGKGKAKEAPKRPASRPVSEASSSDLDVPMALHANKKRRLANNDLGDITAAVEQSIADDNRSVASLQEIVPPKSTPTGKGKGKPKAKLLPSQPTPREQSVESIPPGAGTPKQRKKPGPRKKIDALPPQMQDLLAVPTASAAPSVSGDITPAGSRPPSPTGTVSSAIVFELDEVIPPLKKAKKVDDATMIKRLKGLEEAQNKVWKTIARREVAKVCIFRSSYYHGVAYSSVS